MKIWPSIIISFLLVFITVQDGNARRIHITPDQKAQLAKVQTVLVQALALSEKGPIDGTAFLQTVQSRLEQLGYSVVTDPGQPHDVEFKVKCEERKTFTGTSPSGGDVELFDAPDRLWKGPACLLTYSLNHRDLDWKKEIRTGFADAREAAAKARRLGIF